MVDSTIGINVTANTAGMESGADDAKAAVDGIGATVQGLIDLFLELGGAATGSFREIRTGAESAATSVKGAAASVIEFREAVSGIGEAIIAAFAVEQITKFAEKMGETAEATQHTATTFGITTGQVQLLKGEAAGLGVPFDAVTTAMQRVDRALTTAREGSKQTSAAFQLIGVDVSSSVDQISLLNETLAGLAKIQDVPTRLGVAMQLFGRNIQAIAPLIGVTGAELDQLNAKMETYGVKNDDAQAKAERLAGAMNDNKLAAMGLNNILAQSLAPTLTTVTQGINGLAAGMIKSYQEGGSLRITLDTLDISVKTLASAVLVLYIAFESLAAYTIALTYDLMAMQDVMQGAADKAFPDYQRGIAEVKKEQADAAKGAEYLFKLWANPPKPPDQTSTPAGNGIKTQVDQMQQWTDALDRQELEIKTETGKFNADMSQLEINFWEDKLAKATWGTQQYYDIYKQLTPLLERQQNDAAKKPKSSGESQIGVWTEQLHEAELTAAANSNDYRKDETDRELAFWNQKLANTDSKSKLWYEVQDKIYSLMREKQTEAARADKEAAEESARSAKEVTQEKVKAIQDETAAAVKGVADQLAIEKGGIAVQIALVKEQASAGIINKQQEFGQVEALQQQETQAEINAARQTLADREAGIDRELAVETEGSKAYKKLLDDRQKFVTEEASQETKIWADSGNKQLTDQINNLAAIQAAWHSHVDPIVSSWGSAMTGMIEGTKTFGQAMAQVGESILQMFVGIGEKMVENWIVNLLTQGAQQKLTAAIQVQSNAAVAGSAAVAATAAIPLIGPGLAEAAGFLAYSEAIAFEGLASAAGGYDIPSGINPIVQTHASEMILPSNIANPLRDMLAANENQVGSPSPGGGFGGAGDTHLHIHGDVLDGPSLGSWFKKNGQHVLAGVNSGVRGGGKLKTG